MTMSGVIRPPRPTIEAEGRRRALVTLVDGLIVTSPVFWLRENLRREAVTAAENSFREALNIAHGQEALL